MTELDRRRFERVGSSDLSSVKATYGLSLAVEPTHLGQLDLT